MHLATHSRYTLAGAACLCLSSLPSHALVSLNDGRDKLYVTGSASYSYDSNLFSSSGGAGDFIASATVTAEYSRRAGLIGVDMSVGVNASRFGEYTGENFNNPKFSLEFTKQGGRTTGSLLLGAARESRADSAANIRSESWNYNASLNLRYPVIERYSISGGVGYAKRDFQDNSTLVDLDTLSANVDLFYVYTSERDLIAGYRFRRETTTANTTNSDHGFNVGVSGKILPKLNGNLRLGIQVRKVAGENADNFTSWYASTSLTWNLNKRMVITGLLSKDFNTTSTNISTDTLTGQLSMSFTQSSHWSYSANLSSGLSDFLGVQGDNRSDFFFSYGLDINFTLNQRLKASLGYNYFQNWSTMAFSDFTRNTYTLTVNSRW